MKEENIFNTVQEPTPVEQPVAPVQPTETVQPVEQFQAPVEPQPVQQPMQDVNFNPQPPKKSPAKTILILLLTAVIIGGASFGGYKYYSSTIENKTKGNDVTETTTTTEETTTTTTAKKTELLEFKTMDDYLTFVARNKSKTMDLYLIAMDNNFFNVDYAVEEKCKNDGDKISFEKNGLKIDYTCVKPTDIEVHGGHEEWETTVNVNGKYKLDINTASTCTNWHYFSNGKYFINVTAGCGMDVPIKLELESENNDKIYVGEIITNYVKEKNPDDFKYESSTAVSKDNVIYFVTQASVQPEKGSESEMTTCNLKYIDLNSEKPEVVDTRVSAPCLDITEYKID